MRVLSIAPSYLIEGTEVEVEHSVIIESVLNSLRLMFGLKRSRAPKRQRYLRLDDTSWYKLPGLQQISYPTDLEIAFDEYETRVRYTPPSDQL